MIVIKIFIVLFFFSTGFATAFDSSVLNQHGKDLMKAAFPIRYNFWKEKQKEWPSSTYNERKSFLESWYKKEELSKRTEQAKNKKESQDERSLMKSKEIEKKRLANLEKKYKKERDLEHKITQQEKKSFSRTVKNSERVLKALQKKSDRDTK